MEKSQFPKEIKGFGFVNKILLSPTIKKVLPICNCSKRERSIPKHLLSSNSTRLKLLSSTTTSWIHDHTMPKRKRSTYEDDGDRVQSMRKKDVSDKLLQSKKLLHRALKTAKGFERQKLGKRLKNAKDAGSNDAVTRINGEIAALKGLDLDEMTDAQLYKSLLKVKVLASSELLPEEVKKELPRLDGAEEETKALHNVTSGMWNMKPVKEVMEKILTGMYIAMGIPIQFAKPKGRAEKDAVKGISKTGFVSVPRKTVKDEVEDLVEGREERICRIPLGGIRFWGRERRFGAQKEV